jgi:IS605 OrfB family transposase
MNFTGTNYTIFRTICQLINPSGSKNININITMKSVKINLEHLNQNKDAMFRNILTNLEAISKDYLEIRKLELESKQYKPFKEHYEQYRNQYPELNSGVLQNTLRNMDSLVRSYISVCKRKHKLVAFPTITKVAIPLRNDMYHFEWNDKSKSFDAWLKFLRTNFPLKLCKYHIRTLQEATSFGDGSIYLDSSGTLTLRLVFKTKLKQALGTKTLGIDIGIAKPIVCSDGKIIGSGSYIKHKKLEFGKARAKHQKHKDQITNKQSHWTDDLNHKLSAKLIDHCISNNIGVLALENLKGGHLANRKFRKYSWAFKDLLNKISYKAHNAGLEVIGVDPRYTSQTCSSCGQKEKSNRISQGLYVCSNCGARLNADINAARNIRALSGMDGLFVNQAQGALT